MTLHDKPGFLPAVGHYRTIGAIQTDAGSIYVGSLISGQGFLLLPSGVSQFFEDAQTAQSAAAALIGKKPPKNVTAKKQPNTTKPAKKSPTASARSKAPTKGAAGIGQKKRTTK